MQAKFNDELTLKSAYNACVFTLEAINGKDTTTELLKADSTNAQLYLVANRILAECHAKWHKLECPSLSAQHRRSSLNLLFLWHY